MPLNHVALTVSDRERSAAFYGEHFGLTERVHDDPHLLILGSPDGSLLALSEGEAPRDLPRTNHSAFSSARPTTSAPRASVCARRACRRPNGRTTAPSCASKS